VSGWWRVFALAANIGRMSTPRLLTDLSLEELQRVLIATIAAAGSESGSAEAIRVAIAAKQAPAPVADFLALQAQEARDAS
jgi:hypothetical protein